MLKDSKKSKSKEDQYFSKGTPGRFFETLPDAIITLKKPHPKLSKTGV